MSTLRLVLNLQMLKLWSNSVEAIVYFSINWNESMFFRQDLQILACPINLRNEFDLEVLGALK